MADRTAATSKRSSSSRHGEDNVVGQFIIDKEIGKGSFAQVYSGRHKVTGALVAIKSVELARLNKKLKDNLYGEIKILKKLRHPHIVALHDCVESATHINLIMEYCELGDLSLFIRKRDKLITNSATHELARKYPVSPNSGLHEVVSRHFLQQLASALKFLRAANLIHRDVKPQNLLLLPSPRWRETNKLAKQILSASHDSLTPAAGLPSLPMLKLADFGFARVLPSTSLAETLCGSPLYMAPEILRYERYDARADLWSVGTVLFEMVTGKPPFRASNHVELIRKIEQAEDCIKFSRDCVVSSEMKQLIRALLKRNPDERIDFDDFFNHPVVVGPIPGVVEEDIQLQEQARAQLQQAQAPVEPKSSTPKPEDPLLRRRQSLVDAEVTQPPGSPRHRHASPLTTPVEPKPSSLDSPRLSYSPRQDAPDATRRAAIQPSTSAPGTRPIAYVDRTRRYSNTSRPTSRMAQSPSTPVEEPKKKSSSSKTLTEEERVAQDIAFERDYIFVDKIAVEVNALADQISMYKNQQVLQQQQQQVSSSPKSGQLIRRSSQRNAPASTSGAVARSASTRESTRTDHSRRASYEKSLSSSPGGATSMISKAIQDASLRLFGIKYTPSLLGGGRSGHSPPPQIYNPFPTAYATPAGLIADGSANGSGSGIASAGKVIIDEDARVAQCIEEYATRSDVVYGFAEVKYKQLVPMAPSSDHGLGGVPADRMGEEEDGLTPEAIVALSEEALVLYVKALSIMNKAMHIAGAWWTKHQQRAAVEATNGNGNGAADKFAKKINAAVQWIRNRFNEVLEKAEVVRLKLIDAQKRLPEEHPSHPSNHPPETGSHSGAASGSSGVYLSPGMSAEKLMYDRAVEMSRTAAINEIASEDLPGCEISYVTAIRMLEAVLESDDEQGVGPLGGGKKGEGKDKGKEEETGANGGGMGNGVMSVEDRATVQKMIQMINTRLTSLRKRMAAIANASRAQQQQQQSQQGQGLGQSPGQGGMVMGHRRSGEGSRSGMPSV